MLSPLFLFLSVANGSVEKHYFLSLHQVIFYHPTFFFNYRHVIEYLLYIKHCDTQRRTHLSRLWHDTLGLKWGPFFRLRSAAKHLGFYLKILLFCGQQCCLLCR